MDQQIIDKFWSRVDRGGDNDCWMWIGKTNPGGYGYMTMGHDTRLAHRLSWEIINGPIPHGLLICHKCDNPPCCNPSHLFVGTDADNSRDMVKKGRSRTGYRGRHKPKNTKETVNLFEFGQTLRTLRGRSNITQAQLSKMSGVNQVSISRLETGDIPNPLSGTAQKLIEAMGYRIVFVPTAVVEPLKVVENVNRDLQG